MPQRTDSFDLGRLHLTPGQGRRLELHAHVDDLLLSGQAYPIGPDPLPVTLDVARMTGGGWSLRLRFTARATGPCMRCLEDADASMAIDAREIDQPGGGEDLRSPYLHGDELDVHAWARDALALALPTQIICREECLGLCPECGANLNEAGPDHRHERAPDRRWAKLRELGDRVR